LFLITDRKNAAPLRVLIRIFKKLVAQRIYNAPLLLIGILIVFGGGSSVAPFIYTLF